MSETRDADRCFWLGAVVAGLMAFTVFTTPLRLMDRVGLA